MPSARSLRRLAAVLALGGLAVGALAFATGQLRVALLLFVPIVYGEGPLAALAIVLLFAAVVAWFFAQAKGMQERVDEAGPVFSDRAERPLDERPGQAAKRTVKTGGVVLIGPFPIVWGSDPKTALWVVVATIVLVLVVALLFLRA